MADCEAVRLGYKACVSPPRWLVIHGRHSQFDNVGKFLLCGRHARTRQGMPVWQVRPIGDSTTGEDT